MQHNAAVEEGQATPLNGDALNDSSRRAAAVPGNARSGAGVAKAVRAAGVITEDREWTATPQPAGVGFDVGAALRLLGAAIEQSQHACCVTILLKLQERDYRSSLAILGGEPARRQQRSGEEK